VSLRSAVSASRRRRERDSSSVLREEEMRDRAALSGAMLKFVIVWAMSWDRSQPAALAARWEFYRCGVFVEKHGCGTVYMFALVE
jgi:hypothetical protein